jgi:hypothetical protein
MASAPTEEQISGFMTKLRAFRETLGPDDQKLLDAMYIAAMGKHEEKDEDVQSYWVAAGPRGVAVGGPYGAVATSPWGTAYVRYW